MSIETLIIQAANKSDETATTFDSLIKAKIAERLENMKKDVMSNMFEARRPMYGSESILPASSALGHGSKSSLEQIGKTWNDSKMTVMAVKTSEGKKKFISGSGHTDYHKIGDTFRAHHDQTWRDLGNHTVENIIRLDKGKVVHQENDIGVNEKRPLSVYK